MEVNMNLSVFFLLGFLVELENDFFNKNEHKNKIIFLVINKLKFKL